MNIEEIKSKLNIKFNFVYQSWLKRKFMFYGTLEFIFIRFSGLRICIMDRYQLQAYSDSKRNIQTSKLN